MPTPGALPPTRIISWQQTVLEADPDYWRKKNRPWVYEFSDQRLFYDPGYSGWGAYLTDENGNLILDQNGQAIMV